MTRKDYVKIAQVISDTGRHQASDPIYREGWHAALAAVTQRMANILAEDNPRFDRQKFLDAC